MVLAEVPSHCLVDVELALAEYTGAQLVLLHPQLDIVEEHIIDHREHIESDIILVHLQQLQSLLQLLQFIVGHV